jgi:hypothetical protein
MKNNPFDAVRVIDLDTSHLNPEALKSCQGKPVSEWPFDTLVTLVMLHGDLGIMAHMIAHIMQQKEPECVIAMAAAMGAAFEQSLFASNIDGCSMEKH